MFLPVRTDDVVFHNGAKYLVGNVQVTEGGPLIELLPIKGAAIVVHASEIKLADMLETMRRAKSIGIPFEKVADPSAGESSIELPDGVSKAEAQKALAGIARRKRQKG